MQISSSEIQLAAQHALERKHTLEVTVQQGFSRILAEQEVRQEAGPRERLARMFEQLLEAILAALEGRKCRSESPACRFPERPPASRERTLEWTRSGRETRSESEQLAVCGSGTIRTADGRCINFDLDMKLERSEQFERQWGESGKVVLRDPLVINFAGHAAELGDERIAFDLDSDGKAESIAALGSGSAWLVLDRNGNGRVDCGKELFGAQSGDGFADLSVFDCDGNGWIDSADAVFDQLSLWHGGSGPDALQRLDAAGVGALWLGQVASPFALKGSGGALLGQLRATGLWLSEAGQVGTMQQIDLAVEPLAGDSVPQPGSAPDTGRVAVAGRNDAGGELVGEDMRATEFGKVGVEASKVGESAAEHDHRRVEHVDNARQRTS